MAKSAASRCVMIPDAIRAGAVWLGFSDVAWTDTGARNARQKKVFSWPLMYAADVGKALSVDSRGKLNSNTPLLMSQDELRRVIAQRHANLPRLAKMDVGVGVVGGILDGWNAYMAVQLVDKEGYTAKSSVNLTAAAFGLTGAGVDLMDRILKKLPAEQLRLATPFKILREHWIVRLGRLGSIAKILGAVGGVLTAVVDFIAASEAAAVGDKPIAFLRGATGMLGLILTLLVLFGVLSAGLGFLLFLILAGLSMLGDWLINLIRDNQVEIWLDKVSFGVNEHGFFIRQKSRKDLGVL